MTSLMATPTAAALADMHPKPPADRPGLGQLVLILKLDPLVLDLPATLTTTDQRRVELLIHLPGRLMMRMPAMLLPGTTPRPPRLRLRFPARERRCLTLARPPRLFQLALQLPDPRAKSLVLARQPADLAPQLLVLSRQRRAPRRQPPKLIHTLGRKHLNTRNGDGNHRHRDSRRAT